MSKVVIKLGGGLITQKSSAKTFDGSTMSELAVTIAKISDLGASIFLVHGAGSYGHILAKEWSIAGGLRQDISLEQRSAVRSIRSDMKELNSMVLETLKKSGLDCEGFAPSEWAKGTGRRFSGDLGILRLPDGSIPVTFGDVVDMEDGTEFGILSGDDLMLRISKEMPGVSHAIFLIGDAPGVMDRPPNLAGAKLIPEWSPKIQYESEHYSEIDVTGGIGLKLDRAREISEHVEHVWIIDGRRSDRILELMNSGQTVGTRIFPG